MRLDPLILFQASKALPKVLISRYYWPDHARRKQLHMPEYISHANRGPPVTNLVFIFAHNAGDIETSVSRGSKAICNKIDTICNEIATNACYS